MASKQSILAASSAMAFAAFAGIAAQVPAQADPLPYGPDTCIQGFVWREARPGDTVCVTPDVRATVAQQNSTPGANKDPERWVRPTVVFSGLRLAGGLRRRHRLRDARLPAADVRRQRGSGVAQAGQPASTYARAGTRTQPLVWHRHPVPPAVLT